MRALLSLCLLSCVCFPCNDAIPDEDPPKSEISSVIPEKVVQSPTDPIPGIVGGKKEEPLLDPDIPGEGQIKDVISQVPTSKVRTTEVAEDNERTLELPPMESSVIPVRRFDNSSDNSRTVTEDFSEFYPLPDKLGYILDNTTINAEESIHNTYTTHPHAHGHEHSHGYGNEHAHTTLPQQHHSHVKPLKESIVHRDPHDHFDHYDAIRTQDHDGQSHHPSPHQPHHQPTYGHHLHGSGHGHSSRSNSHSHAHGSGYGSFQPYHYDPHDIPECARTKHYHNVTYCLEDHYYPTTTVQWAIQQSGHYARRLLSDVTYQSADNLVDGLTRAEEEKMTYSHYYGGSHQQHQQLDKYRSPWSGYSYNQDYYKNGGYLCPSNIYYARPRRAMNTYGKWKVIVNLDHPPNHASGHGHAHGGHGGHSHSHHQQAYTQTLRLEHCIYPNSPCSYVDSHYYSRCLQKHNFVRLVAWTYNDGLHLDNFKLPVACSCHVQQPSHYYTPQPHSHHKHHQTPAPAYGHGHQQQGKGHGQGIHQVHAQVLTGLHQGKQNLINSLLGGLNPKNVGNQHYKIN